MRVKSQIANAQKTIRAIFPIVGRMAVILAMTWVINEMDKQSIFHQMD